MKKIKIAVLTFLLSSSMVTVAQQKQASLNAKEFLTKADVFYQKINEQKYPQILDARTAEEFEQAHLPKAVKIDLSETGFEKIFEGLDKNKPVFIYSIQTGRSSKIAGLLKARGHEELYVLAPGISAWIGSGYPVIAFANNKKRIALNEFQTSLNSQEYVLVDYGSNYCPPCKKVIPVLDSLDKTPGNKIKTIKVEIDANPEIIKEYQITALPTIILYKNGEQVWEKLGVPTVNEIINASTLK